MKNFKLFIAVLTLTIFSATASTNNNLFLEENPVKPNEVLRSEIANLIGNDFPYEFEKENLVEVIFTLNSDNELIVISTNANHKEIDYFIKNKLNYKKVSFKLNKNDNIYLIPIRISKS